MHARHPSANITQALVTTVSLCVSAQVIRAQVGVQTQTFIVHGTPRTCSAITQLDSALSADYQQFFAGWTEKDYVDALAWSQACSEYGWHVRGRPRIALLQAQHDRVLGSAQTERVSGPGTVGPFPSSLVQADTSAQARTVSSAATGNVLPSPPVQAAVAAPAQAVPIATTSSALPSPPIEAAVAVPVQAVPIATMSSAPPSPPIEAAVAAPAQAVPIATTSSALSSPPIEAAVVAPAQAVPIATTSSALPSPPIEAAVAAPAQAVPRTATGGVLPILPVPVDIPAQPQAVSSTAKGSALPSSHVRSHRLSDQEEDSLLADNFFKEHFHQESLWVANQANLDIGDDRAPSSWSSSGIPVQMKNRLTADKIVLYCARKTNGESGKKPLLWDLRWCEAEEASAYNRLVSGNEFPTAGRAIVLGCAGVDSYVHLERCMETLTEAGKH